MTDLITCQSVGYRQQGVDILSDISWRIARSQHWAVLGPNGSGKTTLLRIACGYLWPTTGRVLRLGEELIDLGELRRAIGWISSAMIADIPPTDTGIETVVSGRLAQFGLKHLPGVAPTQADFADAADELDQLGCESLADKPFGVLSQGERQQVLIARARMARPLLLVLDEPCAGMDPGVRERFLAWLNERLNDEGCRLSAVGYQPDSMADSREPIADSTIRHSSFVIRHSIPTTILVTHHIEEIVPGIANTLILSGGRVHSAGSTRGVVTRDAIEAVYNTRLARIERSGGRLWPLWGE
jgi:iron complex transport system ATP-binding protein